MRATCKVILGSFAIAAGTIFLPSSAAAQSKACVMLKAGAGYAAKIRVTTGGTQTPWSGSFAIGQEKCIDLKSLGVLQPGSQFSVQVQAIAGKTATCTPSNVPYAPNNPTNLVYIATGTTLNVHCKQPD